jgi:hypothetical protein
MPEGLSTMDGERIDIDESEAAFAAAMAAPPIDQPGMAAPARKPPEVAPLGWTYRGGQWVPKQPRGRRPAEPKGDRARVTSAPPMPKDKAATSGPKHDFRRTIKEAAESLWFALATVPVPDKVFGYQTGGLRTKLRVQAHLVESNVDALAAGLNEIGQHNRFVAAGLRRLQAGEGGLWVLPTVMMLAPFATATGALWSGQLGEPGELDAVAGKVEADAKDYIERVAKQAMDAAAEAVADAREV